MQDRGKHRKKEEVREGCGFCEVWLDPSGSSGTWTTAELDLPWSWDVLLSRSVLSDGQSPCMCVRVCVCVHGSVTHAQVGSTQLMVGSRKGCRCEPLAAAPAAAGAAPLGWDPRSWAPAPCPVDWETGCFINRLIYHRLSCKMPFLCVQLWKSTGYRTF